MKTRPLALWLWYRGDRFRGYQRQVEGPTVQGALEEALAAAGVEATPVSSGRTDRGVHARMQVVSFRPKGGGDAEAILAALRPHLPPAMGIAAFHSAEPSFHAQWSATAKQYRYRLILAGHGPSRWAPFAWRPADEPRLHAHADPARLETLLRRAEGTRDFISFHEKSSPRKPRALWECRLVELGDGLFEARLRGEGFARYQVRYLVGSAVAACAGALPVEAYEAALDSGQPIAGVKAPGQGLILWDVEYPPAVDPFGADRATVTAIPLEPPFLSPR